MYTVQQVSCVDISPRLRTLGWAGEFTARPE